MNDRKWRLIVEVGGIAVVVASLMLVVFELRQNTNALRGSTMDAITERGQFELHWSNEIASIFVKAIQDPSQLDTVEAYRLSEWMSAALNARQSEFVQYQLGLLDENGWLPIENVIELMFSFEWSREWWLIYRGGYWNQDFTSRVDQLIEESNIDYKEILEQLSNIGSDQ
jgi:hypothetical protein